MQKSEDEIRKKTATLGHQLVNMGYDWPKEGLGEYLKDLQEFHKQ